MNKPSTAPFFKYHGLGNDFVVLAEGAYPTDAQAVSTLCDRHLGVGADGILFLSIAGESGEDDLGDADARMTIYNQDGSRPQMCGNGVRCVARHMVEVMGMPHQLSVLSDAGLRRCEVRPAGDAPWQVAVEMGKAVFGSGVPDMVFEGQPLAWTSVDMGNPHAVVMANAPLDFIDALGRWANDQNPLFPEGVNVEFTERVGENHLRVTVYERGVGRTQACGTGACAAAAAAWKLGICDPSKPTLVDLPGGRLMIEEKGDQVWMTGPVVAVFEGTLAPDWMAASTY